MVQSGLMRLETVMVIAFPAPLAELFCAGGGIQSPPLAHLSRSVTTIQGSGVEGTTDVH